MCKKINSTSKSSNLSEERTCLSRSSYLGFVYFTFGRAVGLNACYVMVDPLGIPSKYVKHHLHFSPAPLNDLLTFTDVYHSFLFSFDDK